MEYFCKYEKKVEEDWEKTNSFKKEIYNLFAHRKKLSSKYIILKSTKKMNNLLPNHPGGPIQFYIKYNKNSIVPKGIDRISYFNLLYKNLTDKEKLNYKRKNIDAKSNYYKL